LRRNGHLDTDGLNWFSSSGTEIDPPDSVTFHIWTAYSPFTTWVQIVKDWSKTKGDTGKRKTFVNTTLGETWEPKIGDRPDAEVMAERKAFRRCITRAGGLPYGRDRLTA
jgi:phage terminase large subunit GpA-like protein